MHPSLRATARSQGDVFTHRQAHDAGYSAAEIRQRVASGSWTAMRRGVLADHADVTARADDPRATHLHHAAAALVGLSGAAYLSHRSAAMAWSLPLVGRPPQAVALTIERQHRRRSPGLELHTARTPAGHRASVDGLPVTSAARTLSDLARQLPFPAAVATADAALHRGLCTHEDLTRVVSDCWVWRGIARTKRVLAFVDQRSESPGESLSRVALEASGLPAPELQVELLLGVQKVRVDFMWPDRRLVGEFDGRVKYGGVEDLWREKQREDLIRRHGYGVVRWVWSEVHPDPSVFTRRVAEALHRQRG